MRPGMPGRRYSMDILDRAIRFAVEAHSGAKRKDGTTPYILHPLEVAAIVGTMSSDPELLAAAVLHDTVEDTAATLEELEAQFGPRVAALVATETEDKRADQPPEDTWHVRKEESLRVLEETDDPAVKMLWLGDKLANMRSFYRSFCRRGEEMWGDFHQRDPKEQAWYYKTVGQLLISLRDTPAWREYDRLVKAIFDGRLY